MLLEDVQKVSIRQAMVQRRAALSLEDVLAWGEGIAQRVLNLPQVQEAKSLALYAPIKNEVSTERLFRELKAQKTIFYPRVKGQQLEFIEVNRFEDLVPGAYKVLEPSDGSAADLGEIEAVVLPGVAFDLKGERIGFGKGYYDRTLAHYRGVKIGLGYDFQVVPEIPRDDHDVFCHWVITEKRTIRNPA